MTSDRVYSDFVCLCIRTQLTKEINQKLAKSMPRRRLLRGIYTRKTYLYKKLGVKEGGRRLLEGSIFSGAYGMCNICYYTFVICYSLT